MNFTVNLLPPRKKGALDHGLLMAYAQTMIFIVFIFSLFVAGTLVSVRMLVKANYAESKITSASASGGDSAEVAKSVHELNNLLMQADGRQKLFIPWGEVVERLTSLVPPGTRVDKISIDEKGRITLTGMAPTREDSLELMSRLKETDFFAEVSSPLSNILQKENVKFDFQMKFIGFQEPPADL